jgi:hypothetical protein
VCVRARRQLQLLVHVQVAALLESPNLEIILPRPPCSGAALDDVHIGDGAHHGNLLHGQDVVVVTRKGDKIKGERLC